MNEAVIFSAEIVYSCNGSCARTGLEKALARVRGIIKDLMVYSAEKSWARYHCRGGRHGNTRRYKDELELPTAVFELSYAMVMRSPGTCLFSRDRRWFIQILHCAWKASSSTYPPRPSERRGADLDVKSSGENVTSKEQL